MKSIIKEIFYGKRGNVENIAASDEYFKLAGEIADTYEAIESHLSDEQKTAFHKLCNDFCHKEAEAAETHFIEGVKLGILLGVEASE